MIFLDVDICKYGYCLFWSSLAPAFAREELGFCDGMLKAGTLIFSPFFRDVICGSFASLNCIVVLKSVIRYVVVESVCLGLSSC